MAKYASKIDKLGCMSSILLTYKKIIYDGTQKKIIYDTGYDSFDSVEEETDEDGKPKKKKHRGFMSWLLFGSEPGDLI